MNFKPKVSAILLTSLLFSGCSSTPSSTDPVTKTVSSIPFEETEVYKLIEESFLTSMKDESPSITYNADSNTIYLSTKYSNTFDEIYPLLKYDAEVIEYWGQVIESRTDVCNRTRKKLIEYGYIDVNVHLEDKSSDGIGLYTIYNGEVLYNLANE